ncbi:MAG: aspartate kinase [Caldisericia bacterium]|nr:aspartate kinase [Caldisericia bacterium]
MKLVVQKFGGSSLKNKECLALVLEKIKIALKKYDKVVVVVSAMGKTTNDLLQLVDSFTTKDHPRELDMLLTTGEQISASLLAMMLQENSISSIALNSFQAGIVTNEKFNQANIQSIDAEFIKTKLLEFDVVVVTGFQGITNENEITTLGRGGSDTTAVAFAGALNCPCQIYSDVDGIYSIDPKIYSHAKKLPFVSYEEMLEMSRQGSGILHDRSIEIAHKFNIPIYCASTFSNKEGSMISQAIETIHTKPVIGISLLEKQWLITAETHTEDSNFLKKITNTLQKFSLNIDMIALSNRPGGLSLSLTIWEDDLEKAEDKLRKAQKHLRTISQSVSFRGNLAKVTLVGSNMRKTVGVTDSIFKILNPGDVYMITTSEISISILISSQNVKEVIEKLAKRFSL